MPEMLRSDSCPPVADRATASNPRAYERSVGEEPFQAPGLVLDLTSYGA